MEISRRHLQDTERAEYDKLRDLLVADGNLVQQNELDKALGALTIPVNEQDDRAEEMQRQVDGLTRNQRRVLVKRMKKAGKK